MRNYIDAAFARADLRHIRSFILQGAEDANPDNDIPYKTRLESCSDAIDERLKTLYPIREDYDKAHNDLSTALTVHTDVFTEIGMKLGARLLYQLLISEE